MSVNVYVRNLSNEAVTSDLEDLSAQVGPTELIHIADEAQAILPSAYLAELGIDPTEKLGVIQMASEKRANQLVELLHGAILLGRVLVAMGPHGGIGPKIPK
ncbi:MAG TPA: RNA-binding protein [Pyrinomonadaceae bacterium]|nr:RNA-binding protein [Pyrinomonadaceae bacterium]